MQENKRHILFYAFYCIDYIVGQILYITESNILPTEPPSILEWGTTLYFAHSNAQVEQVIGQLIQIQSFQIILFHILGITGLLYKNRLYASGFVTLIEIVHAFVTVFDRKPYPMMLFLEHVPELFVLTTIALFFIVYLINGLLTGEWQKKPAFMSVDFSTRQEFKSLLRSWAESIIQASKKSGYGLELEPVIAPIGIGMVPRILSKKPRIGMDKVFVDPPGKPVETLALMNSFRLWSSIIKMPIVYLAKYFYHIIQPKVVDSDESDLEYVPSESEDSSDESITSDDSIASQDNIYKELFHLVQDIHSQDPLFTFQSIFQPREQQIETRMCVVCQCEARTVILRPCGCLCLCEDCRERLVGRGTEMCPCCRRIVQGYQRLYQP
jgi:hypothetical protein